MKAVLTYLKALGKRILDLLVRYPLAAAATVFLVFVAVLCLVAGKKVQIGGILGRLWGSKPAEAPRATVAEGRKGEDGKPIAPGVSDDKGFVQAPVSTEIVEPGIFSDPKKVEVVHPEKGKVVIELPEGVKNSDVHEVVEVSPDVYEIKNSDKGVPVKKIDDVLKKF